MSGKNGWIGVELDGVLAYFDRYRGEYHIGRPIPAMVERVRHLLERGETVKVFTHRVKDEDESSAMNKLIANWTEEHVGLRLQSTSVKDSMMKEYYDCRARQIVLNTGKVARSQPKMKEK